MSKTLFDQIGEQLSVQYKTTMGQMFGKPCLKVKNKAFAVFFKESMVFKLGKEEIEKVQQQYPTAENWDPSGKKRPMKDWLQVPATHQEEWINLAQNALQFVHETS